MSAYVVEIDFWVFQPCGQRYPQLKRQLSRAGFQYRKGFFNRAVRPVWTKIGICQSISIEIFKSKFVFFQILNKKRSNSRKKNQAFFFCKIHPNRIFWSRFGFLLPPVTPKFLIFSWNSDPLSGGTVAFGQFFRLPTSIPYPPSDRQSHPYKPKLVKFSSLYIFCACWSGVQASSTSATTLQY